MLYEVITHFYQARDARALQYFKSAGDAALFIYANNEAIHYYSKAIEVSNWNEQSDLTELASIYLSLGRAHELESQFRNALVV